MAGLAVIAAAYALDRSFSAGMIASKWIGLPQYASMMHDLQKESRLWGVAALVLQSAAVLLSVPNKRKRQSPGTGFGSLPDNAFYDSEWIEYFGKFALRVILCCVATIALAVSYLLLAWTAHWFAV
ncbi:MAG: hypothetical protein WB987_08605 [Candidatus Acidiferrales bacterium]